MAKATPVYQLKITLDHIKPPIWRRVQVKDCTLSKLHDIIQAAMGWGQSHLWSFNVGGEEFGDDADGEMDFSSARKAKLSGIVAAGVKKFRYTYDFGDDWEHTLVVEKALSADPAVQYPVCVDGKRACPPEDCGGSWGYGDVLKAVESPGKNPDLLEWLGGEFDPEKFDLAEVNKDLARVR
jgi:hypothetical protein